jgi:hypothetical protein
MQFIDIDRIRKLYVYQFENLKNIVVVLKISSESRVCGV